MYSAEVQQHVALKLPGTQQFEATAWPVATEIPNRKAEEGHRQEAVSVMVQFQQGSEPQPWMLTCGCRNAEFRKVGRHQLLQSRSINSITGTRLQPHLTTRGTMGILGLVGLAKVVQVPPDRLMRESKCVRLQQGSLLPVL